MSSLEPGHAVPGEPELIDGPTSTGGRRGPRHARRQSAPSRSMWVELPILVAVALVVSLLVKAFLVQAFYIPSTSMQHTLEKNDRIVVNKLAQRLGSDIHRGDVVVFRDPGDWLQPAPEPVGGARVGAAVRDVLSWVGLAPAASDQDLVKRVVGVGGDRVVCCDVQGRITVNDVALDDRSYIFAGDRPSELPFTVVVPAGHLWVMGDHRGDSEDSRYHQSEPGRGFVPVSDVVGRAVAVVWPVHRASRLPVPETFEQPALRARSSIAP